MGTLNIKDLRLSELEPDECVALLSHVFPGCTQSGHVVTWGQDEIVVTFKSGERRILDVREGSGANPETTKKLKAAVDAVRDAAVTTAFARRVVFRWGSTPLHPIRWRNEWQISRLPASAPRPKEQVALFPSLLQWTYSRTGLAWLDAVRQSRRYKQVFLPLVPLFHHFQSAALLDPYDVSRKSWVVEYEGGQLTYKWLPNNYFPPDGIPVDSWVDDLGPRQPIWGDGSQIGVDLYRYDMEPYLFAFEKLTCSDKARYLTGCHWYHRSHLADTFTESFLALCFMIEAFLDQKSEKCDTCGQKTYSVSKKFKEFLTQYAGPRDTEAVKEFVAFAARVYDRRSRIAHGGRILAAEHLGFSMWGVPVDEHDKSLRRSLREVGAAALVGWALNQARKGRV